MIWGDESDKANTKFKEVVMPPGFLDKPRDEIMGITRTSPETAPSDTAPRAAARDTGAASGTETWNRTIAPRHRSVVRRYFQSE